MNDDIERLIRTATPGGAVGLAGLEDAVWSRVRERRDRASVSQVRIAVLALALVIGVTNGGLMLLAPRPEPSEMRVFTVSAGLSPLVSLDVRG